MTMIIELRKYNSAKELLIESNSAGLPRQVNYRSRSRKVSVTTAAVRMEAKRMGCKHETRVHTLSQNWEWQPVCGNGCGAIERGKHAYNKNRW